MKESSKYLRKCWTIKLLKFICVILGVCLIFTLGVTLIKAEYPKKHSEYVEKYSSEYGLDEEFVYGIIKAESNFMHNAESHKSATGLMQIMVPTGEWISEKIGIADFTEEMLLDPEVNIEMGCFYISYLLNMYDGNKKNALSAYNAGHSNVDSWLLNDKYSRDGKNLDIIPYPETEKYVNVVITNEKIYKYLYKIYED